MVEPSTAEAEALVYIVDDDASVRAAIEDLLASVGLCAVSYTHLTLPTICSV